MVLTCGGKRQIFVNGEYHLDLVLHLVKVEVYERFSKLELLGVWHSGPVHYISKTECS